jgi:3',5'-cyclic AMP phosphodiesterase CpdA
VSLLGHISDLHVDGTPRAAERVKRAVDHLRAMATPPDALLVTGDIADLDAPVGIALHMVEDRQITTHFRTIAAGS